MLTCALEIWEFAGYALPATPCSKAWPSPLEASGSRLCFLVVVDLSNSAKAVDDDRDAEAGRAADKREGDLQLTCAAAALTLVANAGAVHLVSRWRSCAVTTKIDVRGPDSTVRLVHLQGLRRGDANSENVFILLHSQSIVVLGRLLNAIEVICCRSLWDKSRGFVVAR